MLDIIPIITIGTALLLLLGMFISYMTLTYQKKRLIHKEEVIKLAEGYQKEILKAKVEMQEQTFLDISQEIHDNVGQTLSLARLNISTLKQPCYEVNGQKISNTKDLLDHALEELRNLSKRLNSNYTKNQGLTDLLQFQTELLKRTETIDAQFQVTGEERPLSHETKLLLLRIAQEAINNVVRHSEATCLFITLRYSPGNLTLSISDNGKGIKDVEIGKGTGTGNMKYRAELIGASLKIGNLEGPGTIVQLKLPLTTT